MRIGEDEYGMVIAFESKKQYSFAPNQVIFRYYGYVQLDCSFEVARANIRKIRRGLKFARKETLCSGDLVKEC